MGYDTIRKFVYGYYFELNEYHRLPWGIERGDFSKWYVETVKEDSLPLNIFEVRDGDITDGYILCVNETDSFSIYQGVINEIELQKFKNFCDTYILNEIKYMTLRWHDVELYDDQTPYE